MKNGFLLPQEIVSMFDGLNRSDKSKLVQIARRRSLGTELSGDDLIQESILRVLDGRRPWPRHQPPVPFLAGIIRSISSEYRKTPHDELTEAHIDSRNGESSLMVMIDTLKIIESFSDDVHAQIILKGLFEGLQGEELQELSGLNDTAYQSKRRKIRRRIDQYVADCGKE